MVLFPKDAGRRRLPRPWMGGVLAAAVVLALPGAGRAAPSDDLFQRLLKDPGNVELNLEYAGRAVEEGHYTRAMAAYERILGMDPENATARRGLRVLKKSLLVEDRTDVYGFLGGQYSTNNKRLGDDRDPFDDGSANVGVRVRDQRHAGLTVWRTDVQANGIWHNRFDDGDLLSISAETGPDLLFSDVFVVRPVAGVAAVAQDLHYYASKGILGVELEPVDASVVRDIAIKGAVADYGSRYPGRDAWIGDAGMTFGWRSLADPADQLLFKPDYRFNGAEEGRYRYHQERLNVSYEMPVIPDLSARFGVAGTLRQYDGAAAGENDDRRDWSVAPSVVLVKSNLFDSGVSLSVHYIFESQHSNDATYEYDNHVVGGNLIWKF